jgi:GNAT superfamily N-acetyltransferase
VTETRQAVVTVRPARPGEAREIAEVHVAAWRWAYEGQLPASVLEGLSIGEREAMWRRTLADPKAAESVAVAEDDSGRIVGFASWGPTEDADAPHGTGEVYAIYLLHDVQGTGVGRALFERAERGLRESGFTRATLWVLESNELGRRFYERAAWTWDGRTSDHRFDCDRRPIVRYAVEL